MKAFSVVALLCIFALCEASLPELGTIFFDPVKEKYSYASGKDPTGAAYGQFEDALFEFGWGGLHIHSNDAFSDEVQAYAAGMLEGMLTAEKMSDYFVNTKEYSLKSEWPGYADWPEQIVTFMNANEKYTRTQMAALKDTDDFWYQVNLVMAQFDGLLKGYNSRAPDDEQMTTNDLWILNCAGDLDDLAGYLVPGVEKTQNYRDRHHHCTGIVKVLPDFSDLFFTQVTWSNYVSLNRILKVYDLPFNHQSTQSQTVSFSSYPSILFSVDDFYITDAKLAVLETTFNIFNETLYDLFIRTDVPLTWMRTIIANRMASTGREWVEAQTRYNSGTYNNQWVVVDYKHFRPGVAPTSGLVTVAEMIPGHQIIKDVTQTVRTDGYWPSINTPSDVGLFDLAGFPEQVAKFGDYWSLLKCSRYLIMERDLNQKVTDFDSFKQFTRFNDYLNDPLSNGDPGQEICSRYDLRPPVGPGPPLPFNRTAAPFGGLDSKCTNYELATNKLKFDAISSPTYDQQPVWKFGEGPFAWVPYRGVPAEWKFPWISFSTDESGLSPHGQPWYENLLYVIAVVGLIGGLIALVVYAIRRAKESPVQESSYRRMSSEQPLRETADRGVPESKEKNLDVAQPQIEAQA